MASTSRRQRRERRFRRYLSAGRLARAQALLQRHPGLDVDAGQPPPLHRACARHDAPALCLLLRLGADPAHQDRHGNTALHAAARQGPDAYTDFFLPLLRRCPSAMGIKNKDGETPGQILGWGPPWGSAAEEEEDRRPRSTSGGRSCRQSWRTSGRRPLGGLKTMLPMRPRNPSPSQPGQIAWPGSMPRSASSSGSGLSWRRLEEERRLFQERARAKEEELRESRARRAQAQAQAAHGDPGPRAQQPRGVGRGNLWRFSDVPWPCPGGGDPEAMAAALGPPLEEQEALRRYLRAQQVRWHPDRFLQRFRSQIEAWELGRVMAAVTALSQALNRRAEALKTLPFSTAVVFIAHDIFPPSADPTALHTCDPHAHGRRPWTLAARRRPWMLAALSRPVCRQPHSSPSAGLPSAIGAQEMNVNTGQKREQN
ncbi:LOW QUALITY PROTEIN: hypothetical protein QTO34_013030 [Cnephaeus nilssonii]|uniref:NF-kappa-B inhibitor-like protein 1 n=1 Tax=Cnephaeus nilssonii TaxID=3371016 RepID=A0AA40HAG5_CNENI|nr:LOW QUALITY PROTEIN: hypothetical protein QTO34_013030 [Eptesicus nilssonii]